MKKLSISGLVYAFIIMQNNLYCFDLIDDAFDFIEDIGKLVGIIFMIAAVMYFIKKFLKDDRTSGSIKRNDDERNYRRRRGYYDDDYEDYDDRRTRRYDDEDDRRTRRYDDEDDRRIRRYDNCDRDVRKKTSDGQYEYDLRDYDRREKRLPNKIDDDPRYEKVYELKPEYKLKSNSKKK
ncbi:hypothetical protein R4K54_13660 [Brachyspira murdochii]|uniref:Uncharacterized protein n=1 Tax=Brachyspira murdochii (strain ATCC 51284 / DSM 12563 / 56-150) TaxID=526224 RepID=D5U9A8_BRAM5|nr:hypothetical protein [Brachyspira murdochii]ADG71281.1 conserved hypothetical protein [Brachyspira murdochii DSM 12563]